MKYETILIESRKDVYTKKMNDIQDAIRKEFSNSSIAARVSGSNIQNADIKAELLEMGYISLKHLLRDCSKGVLTIETIRDNNIKLVDDLVQKFLNNYIPKFIPSFRDKVETIITPERALQNIEKLLLNLVLETLKDKEIDEQLKDVLEANMLFKNIFNDYRYEFAYKKDEECLVLVALTQEQYLEFNKMHKIVF